MGTALIVIGSVLFGGFIGAFLLMMLLARDFHPYR